MRRILRFSSATQDMDGGHFLAFIWNVQFLYYATILEIDPIWVYGW